MPTDIDLLTEFSFFNKPSVLNGLKQEFPAYIAKAADLSELLTHLLGGISIRISN